MSFALVLAATLGTLTVEAGAFDRAQTPVVFDLPAALAGRRLELRGPEGPPLPVQTVAPGRALFILPSLKKATSARFDLREAEAAPPDGVTVRRYDGALELHVGGERLGRYVMQGRAPSADVPATAVRGGYLHPLFTPSGTLVTDDYHPKHRAHHGIWTAWTNAETSGRKISFWGSSSGRNDFVGLDGAWSGPLAGGFAARHASTDLSTSPPRTLLDEEWTVVIYRLHDARPPYYVFDLEWTDRARDEPLVLPEYRYGGLGLRGHALWDGEANLAVLTSEGVSDRAAAEGTRGRWIHLGGQVHGSPAGFAALVHPDNFRAPQPFRVHPNEPFVCIAPAKAGGFAIEPGRPYVSRYRFVVADGPADGETLDRLWNDYAHPPAARANISP